MRLRLLAAPAVQAGGKDSLNLPPKDALLLALLALEGPRPRDALAQLLWPDAEPANQRGNLRQRIKRLQDHSHSRLLDSRGPLLALADGVEHDLQHLAETLAVDPQAARGTLLGHLQLDDSAAAEWLAQARQRLDLRRRQALQARAQALEDALQLDAALAYAQRLATDDPLHEESQRRLMRLHHRRGDRSAALASYRALRQRLHDELGAEPDPQTRGLAAMLAAAPPAPAPVQQATTQAALLRPPQLLQREAEWAQLLQVAGTGGIVLVLGDAGMGKTRLLHDFADHLGWGLRVQARPGDSAVPCALLARWAAALEPQATALPAWARAELARLLPALGDAPAGELAPLRFTQAFALLCQGQPGVLLDDLHFADAASLDLLPALLAAVPCALLAARRHDLPPALQAWLQQAGSQVRQLQLLPWQVETIASFLHQAELPSDMRASWAAPLWQHTGGHPLLVLETLREVLRQQATQPGAPPPARLPAPQPLLQLLAQRLQALSPRACELVQLAALAGEHFGPELATQVLDVDAPSLAPAWQEVQDAAMLSPRGQWHDLVLEAARGLLTAPQASALHERIAAQLSQQGCPPGRLAEHWAAAGQPAPAAACHEAAAAQAGRLSRHIEEAGHFEQAALCWVEAGEAERGFTASVEACNRRLRAGETGTALAASEGLLTSASSLQQQAMARRVHAIALMHGADYERGLLAAGSAQASAHAAGLPHWAAEMAAMRAQAAATLGRHELARQCLAEEAALPASGGDWEHDLIRHSLVANVWTRLGQLDQALQRTEHSIALADRPEARSEHITLLGNSATILMLLGGRNAEALERARVALAAATRQGEQAGLVGANIRMHVGLLAGSLGHYGEAVDALARCLADLQVLALPRWVLVAENHLIGVWAQLGQATRALQLLQADEDTLPPNSRVRRWTLRHDLQRLCGTRAPNTPAPELGAGIDPTVAAWARLALLRTASAQQRLEQAPGLADDLAAASMRGHAMQARLLHLQALAELAPATAGAPALALLDELRGHAPHSGYAPEALWLLHQALEAAGETGAAAEALADAARWITDTAQNRVHPEHRDAFLRRNRVNAAVLGAWAAAQQAP